MKSIQEIKELLSLLDNHPVVEVGAGPTVIDYYDIIQSLIEQVEASQRQFVNMIGMWEHAEQAKDELLGQKVTLLEQRKELEAKLKIATKALEFYAHKGSWMLDETTKEENIFGYEKFGWSKAAQALKEIE